jgi:hypothetical protein
VQHRRVLRIAATVAFDIVAGFVGFLGLVYLPIPTLLVMAAAGGWVGWRMPGRSRIWFWFGLALVVANFAYIRFVFIA